MRCLAKTSADRYPSAEAFATSLDAFVRHGKSTSAASGVAVGDCAPELAGAGGGSANGAEVHGNSHDARRQKSGWLARPLKANDAWFAAGLVATIAVTVLTARAARQALNRQTESGA